MGRGVTFYGGISSERSPFMGREVTFYGENLASSHLLWGGLNYSRNMLEFNNLHPPLCWMALLRSPFMGQREFFTPWKNREAIHFRSKVTFYGERDLQRLRRPNEFLQQSLKGHLLWGKLWDLMLKKDATTNRP